jgi:intracellular multiplication protein IcmK
LKKDFGRDASRLYSSALGMDMNKIIIIFVLLSMSIFANAQENGQTNNSQQMLEQVRQLQQQQIAAQTGQAPPATASQNQSQLQGQLYNNVNAPAQTNAPQAANSGGIGGTYSPDFKAPFKAQQVNTPGSYAIQQNAFANTVQSILPMSPEQIHRLRQLYTASQYAAAAPAGVPPKPTATSLFVDLSPGATPPAINLAEGDITALVFLDSTGAPWPIAAYDNGNPNAFNVVWNKKDNVLMIQATQSFAHGNLAVRLRELGPPVMISLVTNTAAETGGTVDYRVDMRIPGFGPNAYPVPASGMPGNPSKALLDVLDGIPPTGSKVLDVSDSVAQAWVIQNKLFLRTRLTLLSPAWLQTMSSADGTHAYMLQVAPLLLMAQNGKVIQVKIQGF